MGPKKWPNQTAFIHFRQTINLWVIDRVKNLGFGGTQLVKNIYTESGLQAVIKEVTRFVYTDFSALDSQSLVIRVSFYSRDREAIFRMRDLFPFFKGTGEDQSLLLTSAASQATSNQNNECGIAAHVGVTCPEPQQNMNMY